MDTNLDTTLSPSAAELAVVEAQILCRSSGRIRNLRLSLCDDGLVLTGSTQTYFAKQIAQHSAMQMLDVPIFANDIEVR